MVPNLSKVSRLGFRLLSVILTVNRIQRFTSDFEVVSNLSIPGRRYLNCKRIQWVVRRERSTNRHMKWGVHGETSNPY